MRVIPGRGCVCGVVGRCWRRLLTPRLLYVCVSGSGLEWPAVVGESPVRENMCMRVDDVPRVAAGSWNLL